MSNVCSMHGDLNLLAATVLSSVYWARAAWRALILGRYHSTKMAADLWDSLVWPY